MKQMRPHETGSVRQAVPPNLRFMRLMSIVLKKKAAESRVTDDRLGSCP